METDKNTQQPQDYCVQKIHDKQALSDFCDVIKKYYQESSRSFAWRKDITPYRVVVSEVMLQQTQTDRVAIKFDQFISSFPDFYALAHAPFDELLRVWKGLGYNRRAIALQKIAQRIIQEFDGNLPDSVDLLATFPGIGRATASSIIAFAHNKPTAFIETNIRTVFIYFFFKNAVKITDKEIQLLVEETVDHNNPREWYYALMDYGVMLKKTVGNLNRLSAHYHKQSKFQGSDRQIRGQILQVLLDQPGIETAALVLQLGKEEARVLKIIDDLCQESFIQKRDSQLWLAKNS